MIFYKYTLDPIFPTIKILTIISLGEKREKLLSSMSYTIPFNLATVAYLSLTSCFIHQSSKPSNFSSPYQVHARLRRLTLVVSSDWTLFKPDICTAGSFSHSSLSSKVSLIWLCRSTTANTAPRISFNCLKLF